MSYIIILIIILVDEEDKLVHAHLFLSFLFLPRAIEHSSEQRRSQWTSCIHFSSSRMNRLCAHARRIAISNLETICGKDKVSIRDEECPT